MSSARKRRSDLAPNPPPPGAPKLVPAFPSGAAPPAPQNPRAAGGGVPMTLQQIINITDKRLTTLEGFMAETRAAVPAASPVAATNPAALSEVYSRFDVLVDEVSQLKETLMKLQTYTLEINHILMKERVAGGENIPEPPALMDSVDVLSAAVDEVDLSAVPEVKEEVPARAFSAPIAGRRRR